MAERYRPDTGARSPSETDDANRDDPLAELARIVSSPSTLDTPRGRPAKPGALQDHLESELPADLPGVGRPASRAVATTDWPPPDSSGESEFDEFAHMHLRAAGRRSPASGEDAAPADNGWDPIEITAEAGDDNRSDSLLDALPEDDRSDAYREPYVAAYSDTTAPAEPADPYRSVADGADADFSLGRYGAEGFDEAPAGEDAEGESMPPPQSGFAARRGLLLAGAAALVLVLGGVGAIAFMSMDSGGTSGAPQTITADSGPVKVAPANQGSGASGAASGKAIYDRVDNPGADRMRPGETANTAPVQADGQQSAASREISRIILPDGSGTGGSGTTGGNGAAGGNAGARPANTPPPAADSSTQAGPKRVRTVIVRPDGTIVSSAPAAGPTNANVTTTTNAPPAGGNSGTGAAPAATGAAGAGGPVPRPNPGRTDTTATVANTPPAGSTAPTRSTTSGSTTTVTGTVPGQGANAADRVPTAANRGPAATGGGPVSLVPDRNAAPPTRTASTGGGGNFVVQVTSQRSESAAVAAYRDLQKRFPQLLGDRTPDMQRVDLGQRGVFYRMRVGPAGSESAANAFCDQLKAAGADCVPVAN